MLYFNEDWRFEAPATVSDEACAALRALILRVAATGPEKAVLEHFKGAFASAAGRPVYRSSDLKYARGDLDTVMQAAAGNAPLFLEALHDGLQTLGARQPNLSFPTLAHINRVLRENGVEFEIAPPNLIHVGAKHSIAGPLTAPSLDKEAQIALQEAWVEAESLLAGGKPRLAVQENLWLLESLMTAFKGLEVGEVTITGKYFNKIVQSLRQAGKDTILAQVLSWMTTLHGFLSSPTGGGVRHGRDLREGITIDENEARLYCNLIRSYVGYLLDEYERLQRPS